MITASELSFGPDREHSRREEPRLGCNCRDCFYAREEHIEEALLKLYRAEQGHDFTTAPQPALLIKLPIISQAVLHYLHGAIGYEDMKTKLIEQLWGLVQDHHQAEMQRVSLSPMQSELPQ